MSLLNFCLSRSETPLLEIKNTAYNKSFKALFPDFMTISILFHSSSEANLLGLEGKEDGVGEAQVEKKQ